MASRLVLSRLEVRLALYGPYAEIEPNDTVATANPVDTAAYNNLSGTLWRHYVETSPHLGIDVDFYKVSAEAGTSFSINGSTIDIDGWGVSILVNYRFRPVLQVFSPTMQLLAQRDTEIDVRGDDLTGGFRDSVTGKFYFDPLIIYAETGGDYIIKIVEPDTAASQGGFGESAYALRVKVEPPKPTDLIATELTWNVTRGPGVPSPQRGIDATYRVEGHSAPIAAPIAFYWASGTAWNTRIGEPLPTASMANTAVNSYTFNEPARWGVPPANAKYILVALDPPDGGHPRGLIEEADETNNIKAIRLHSAAEVLTNAVSVRVDSNDLSTIRAVFQPGTSISGDLNASMKLSEAEVAVGVDHFNWQQQVIGLPNGWQPITITGLEYSRVGSNLENLLSAVRNGQPVLAYANSNDQVDELPADSVKPVGKPFFDPLVTFGGTSATEYTRAFVYPVGGGVKLAVWLNIPQAAGTELFGRPQVRVG